MRLIFVVFIFLLFSCRGNETKGLKNNQALKDSIAKAVTIEVENVTDSTNISTTKKLISDSVTIAHELDYSIKLSDLLIKNDSVEFLKKYFLQFKEHKDSISEILFFKGFPANFKTFISFYGFDEETGEKPLYNSGEEHIWEYSKIRTYVNDSIYYNKLINIASKGEWEPDNVDFIQEILMKEIKENPKTVINLLQYKDRTDVLSFWEFYFDGPHPKREVPSFLKEAVSNDMYLVIEQALQNIQQKWKRH